ncbi:MAG: (d)CMP kinase [Candidatus Cloacimonetes bacterium]|nr:(d)CMP kinase [Candidatus Cloacimonadota bacterium]
MATKYGMVVRKMIIAIDGPAASGKSTAAKQIAQHLNMLYIDTGAMYRGVALNAFEQNVAFDNLLAMGILLENIKLDFKTADGVEQIYLNGKNVTTKIRSQEITKLSSEIATIKIVRAKMVELQRTLSKNHHDVILEGRDIGTVVFPNADVKFFLVASIEERAKRRLVELVKKGVTTDFEQVKSDLLWRDKNDSMRVESPLLKAEDAVEIDTTHLTLDAQVKKMMKIIQKKTFSSR